MKLTPVDFQNLTRVGRIGCIVKDRILCALYCAACTRKQGRAAWVCVWDEDSQGWICPECGVRIGWQNGCLMERADETQLIQYTRIAQGEAAAESLRRGFISQWALNLRWEQERQDAA